MLEIPLGKHEFPHGCSSLPFLKWSSKAPCFTLHIQGKPFSVYILNRCGRKLIFWASSARLEVFFDLHLRKNLDWASYFPRSFFSAPEKFSSHLSLIYCLSTEYQCFTQIRCAGWNCQVIRWIDSFSLNISHEELKFLSLEFILISF